VLIIDRGRIVAEGTPAELRGKLAGTPVVRAVFRGSAAGARETLAALDGVTAVEVEDAPGETRARLTCAAGSDPREDVFRLAVAKGWTLRELGREAMTLEDVFVRLTRREEPEPAEDAGTGAPRTGTTGEEEPAS
jgi:ABC-2 type transport system ATP-binding protein